jgi:hypothetical protein
LKHASRRSNSSISNVKEDFVTIGKEWISVLVLDISITC